MSPKLSLGGKARNSEIRVLYREHGHKDISVFGVCVRKLYNRSRGAILYIILYCIVLYIYIYRNESLTNP